MKTIILTYDLIEDGISNNGGWSDKQLRLLGVEMPKLKGWRRELIGRKIRLDKYEDFIALRNAHLKNKNRFKKKHKNSVLLDKALAFILKQFTINGEFVCPAMECDQPCDGCEVQKDFNEIFDGTQDN